MIRSPCIGVCTVDERFGTCAGCYRTLDEIAAWPTMADEARRAVLARAAARKARPEADDPDPMPPRPAGDD